MLKLIGENGKSIIVDAIQKYRNAVIYIYDKENVNTLNACFVSQNDYTVEEFCTSVKNGLNGLSALPIDTIILYTNSPDINIYSELWNLAEELEEENYAITVIVASK